jgi:hypothetical protein
MLADWFLVSLPPNNTNQRRRVMISNDLNVPKLSTTINSSTQHKTVPIAYLDYFEGDETTGVGKNVTIATINCIDWFPIHEETVYVPGGAVGSTWVITIDGIDEYHPCMVQKWFPDWEAASIQYSSDEHSQFAQENVNFWRWNVPALSQRLNNSI